MANAETVEQHTETKRSLSEILEVIFDEDSKISTFQDLVGELDQHGIAVVLILFAVPSAMPVPAAGYSTILSIPLMIIGLRLLFGYHTLWLPEKMKAKEFQPAKFAKYKKTILSIVQRIEKISKPRFAAIVHAKITRIFLGVLICSLAASMALPIPGTNTLPAGGIFLIGFSLLESDGLLLAGGILYSTAALCLTVLIITFGYEVVKAAILALFGG